ncbi:hypothetical protein TNCV_2616161 [Trichonephila clavipes]|nr:hypothetical protein TNCV_2616161 [Trichonephila clavipes]
MPAKTTRICAVTSSSVATEQVITGLATKTPRPEVQILTYSPVPSERLVENRPVLKRLNTSLYQYPLQRKPLSRKPSREVGGRGRDVGEAPDHTQGVLPQNWGETEANRPVTCMVLKAMTNNRRHLALCHDEFHGP